MDSFGIVPRQLEIVETEGFAGFIQQRTDGIGIELQSEFDGF